jgi:signal transduction histidine kinase
VVAVAGLGLRRRAPLLAPWATIAVVTWWTTLWPAEAQGPFEGFLLMIGAAYCLGSLHDRRKLAIGAGTLVAWFVIGLFVDLVGGRAGDVAPIAVWLAIGFGVGYLISRRTEQARQAWEATRVLAAEQERQTARADEDERARIVRELHDVVAHGLSVIVVQAGAERRSLHGPNVDEESIDAALGSIERVGREALVDLRRLLGLLRRTDDPVALSPQPGLAQLDDLLSSVREAGLQVDVDISGDQSQLPPGLDLTAYRIVQEALTNVLKHANAHCVGRYRLPAHAPRPRGQRRREPGPAKRHRHGRPRTRADRHARAGQRLRRHRQRRHGRPWRVDGPCPATGHGGRPRMTADPRDRLTIVIADDQLLLRAGFRKLLDGEDG